MRIGHRVAERGNSCSENASEEEAERPGNVVLGLIYLSEAQTGLAKAQAVLSKEKNETKQSPTRQRAEERGDAKRRGKREKVLELDERRARREKGDERRGGGRGRRRRRRGRGERHPAERHHLHQQPQREDQDRRSPPPPPSLPSFAKP